jgi:predicted dehydrogenase
MQGPMGSGRCPHSIRFQAAAGGTGNGRTGKRPGESGLSACVCLRRGKGLRGSAANNGEATRPSVTRRKGQTVARVFRVGLIGCGGIANRHATILQNLERTELVAFCDIAEERARDFNEKYADGKAKVFSDYHQMFEKEPLDVVYICLPPFAHADEVEVAAGKGVHVFIEKPIALTMELADRMVAATDRAGVKTQVGFMSRFGEAVERVKALLDSGKAGPPGLMLGKYFCNALHAPWWREKEKSGGQIVEQIIHTYDIVRYLLGEPESVFARTANLFHQDVERYTSEDVSATVITFKNGAVATVAGSNGAIPGRWISSYELVAKNLTVSFADANRATLTHTDQQPPKVVEIQGSRDISEAETQDLLDAIEQDRVTRTPMIEGARTLELVLAANRAGETGQVVTLG